MPFDPSSAVLDEAPATFDAASAVEETSPSFDPSSAEPESQHREFAYPDIEPSTGSGLMSPEQFQATQKTDAQLAVEVANKSFIEGILPRPQGDNVGAGITRGIESVVESIPTPANVALAATAAIGGPVVSKVIGAAFGAHMIKQTPEMIGETVEAFKEGKIGEGAERATVTVANALLGGLAMKHATSRPGAGGLLEGETAKENARVGHEDIEVGLAKVAHDLATKHPEEIAAETTLAPDITGETTLPKATESAPSTPEAPRPQSTEQAGVAETQPEPISVGPGAASAHENLIAYEERKFGQRFQETESVAPEIREATGNRYYEPIPNKVTVAEAEGIIDARGIDEATRLVRDPEFPMEHRVRTTVAQALIKKLNEKYQATKGTPEGEQALNQAVDAAEYVGEFGTQLGQGVQAFAIWSKLTPEGMLVAAQRQVKKGRGKGLTPEEAAKINDMTAEIEKAPEGFQKDEKTVDLLNYMSKLKGADPADIPTALYYANILSGYSTQLVNTIDTGLNVLSEAGAMAASHPSAVPDILSGLYRGMIKGGFEAASVLKTGRSPTGDKIAQQRILERTRFGEKEGVPIKADTTLGRFMKAAFESKAAKPLNLWKYPLRAMIASDTVMFNSMKEARMRVLARVMAKDEGLKGDALFQRVDEILHSRSRESATAKAESEGLTGIRKTRRINEIQQQGRPEELVADADDFASVSTYNHTPSGALGMIATKVGEMARNYKPLVVVVPFTRIIANVTNRGLDYTPYGFKRLFLGQGGGERFATESPTGEAFRTQLIKATLGTTAMTAIAALDASGKIEVTAKGPEDQDERNQLKNAGWKPYSVKVGDKYLSYQYTPLNLAFATIGHYRDAIRYNKLSEKDAQTRLAYGMQRSMSTIFDMSFLSGVNDFMESLSGARTSTQAAAKMLGRTVTSAIIPNLVKQLDRLFDPTIYSANSVTEAVVRETPVARGTALKPLLNVLGERITYDNNRFFSTRKNDPVWKFIIEKQAWVPVPSKTSKVGNRAISPDEYYELVEKSGPKIRGYIQSNLSRFKSMKTEEIQDDIRAYATEARKGIKAGFATRRP